MKKVLIALSLFTMMLLSGISPVSAQDEPKPKKDTVNMDTNAKPEKFYEVEDETTAAPDKKGSAAVIAIIAGAVVIAAGAVFLLMKKKK
jgi:hypothetical protein